jgi:ATP-binding cassette subfamily C (CFTR/MRP) protein 1
MAFFFSTDIGSITTRFSQDIQLIDTQLPLALMCVVSYIFICTSQALLIASATFYIALSFPALLAVFYFIQKFYLRTSRQLRFMDLEEKAPVYTQFLEALGGLSTIRAFSWQAPLKLQNQTLVNRSQKPFYLLFIGQRWLTLVLDLIACAMAVIVVSVAVKMRGAVSASFTGVSLTQLVSFTANMKLLISFWTQMETSIGAVARIKQFEADTKDENRPEEWPSRGEIVFENVSASYR